MIDHTLEAALRAVGVDVDEELQKRADGHVYTGLEVTHPDPDDDTTQGEQNPEPNEGADTGEAVIPPERLSGGMSGSGLPPDGVGDVEAFVQKLIAGEL